ncbi:hypothetical protein CFP56_019753 [Quercus suber]|uniref:Uncharacterized protein n=1 Tax=Quercus suber TaxID=58331 RepID=A0AAW0M2Z5_QUESU
MFSTCQSQIGARAVLHDCKYKNDINPLETTENSSKDFVARSECPTLSPDKHPEKEKSLSLLLQAISNNHKFSKRF